MNIYEFIEIFPNEIKQKYISNLVHHKGNINDELWNEIINYLNKNFKNIENYKEAIKILLKESNSDEKQFIKNEINKSEEKILNDINDILIDLEDILTLDKFLIKKALQEFDKSELVKATYIVSPAVIEYFHNIYPDIDFINMREKIGNISVEEALIANKNIVNTINIKYNLL